MQALLQQIWSENRVRNLGLLLVFVVLLQFGYPITLDGRLQTALYMLLYVGMIFFGIMTAREERQPRMIVAGLGIVFFFFAIWFTIAQDSRDAALSMLASLAAFSLALMVSLMRFIFRRVRVAGAGLILAAVCIYLIMGGFFSATFSILEIAQPGSFEDTQLAGQSLAWQQLMYYSYVTMATLGYGDIVPVTPWARSLASFEGVAGTLFLTIVIARLVGVWTRFRAESS
ncbi:MAG TPA: ion channel [Jiangellaceae bacterium]|nr:ion channel [Jiangellaceae bacterium]